ncbi:hypothetical protein BGZ80_005609 [Entomortierella chlamydospora]|uniref:Nucleoporin Nup133/Nup155-like C-terminal domain-containing protein n=1 Tax=Entomortierella chlamydospora TaxID=101097 RepID=A0A9P6T291_9FUNG|nr:hypothetical protein BGZ80_005609 [Entomortierella chlamydospora]
MFAAKAPKGGIAAKPKEVREQSDRTDNKLEHAPSSLSLNRVRRTFSSFPAGSDSEAAWTPIREDTLSDDGTSRHISKLGDVSPIDEDYVYSKNDRTMVAYFGPLPREVDDALSKTDFYTQPMEAKIDFDAGFGIAVSQTTCYIWGVQKPMGYYFGTRYANVYHVSVRKQFGSIVLSSTQLHGKSTGAIASLYNMIGISQGPDTSQKVRSLTSGPKIQDQHGRWDLYALTQRNLYKWHLYRSGECTLESEVPLKEKVTERILRDYSGTLPLGSDPEVRLLDIEYIKNGKLLLLVTFFDTAEQYVTTPLSCAIFTLSPQFGPNIDIESVKYIQRTIEEDLRPQASPRLVVPKGGPGVFIVMPKAVIISSTLSKDDFEDLVPLKSDKIIGFGTEEWKQRGLEMEDSSELPIICRASGRLGINIQVNGDSNSLSSVDDLRTTQEQLTAQLQAKLEQAVFFGGKKNNPISFDLAHYDGGDLNEASLNVSREILNSHATLLNSGKDLTARLSERYQRIKTIIESIQAAEMASRLSIDTRFQLCWGAEKLAAANALWNQYQLKLTVKDKQKTSRTNLRQVVDAAAAQTLQKLGAHTTEDPISFFMKYHVDHLAELLSNLERTARKLTLVSDGQWAELTRDINKIIVLSLRSAWNYRKQNVANYALQGSSSVAPWTATKDIIESLTAQYTVTLSICRKNPGQEADTMDVDGPSYLSSELHDQLCDLADVTLQAHSEHLQYLEGLPLSSVNNIAIAAAVNDYDNAKLELLTPLVELKKTLPAIQLAQRYKDFTTLVNLSIGQEKQIANYISKYQQEFANALFQWYYDNDQISNLLEIGERNSDLFTVYLDNRDYGEISWIHDIKIRRFVEASQRVQDGAILEMDVNRRRTMFSLSKLFFLAGVSQHEQQQEQGVATAENMMRYASRNNEELEMATVQVLVAEEWEHQVGALASVEDKARAVVDTFGSPVLTEQTTLRKAIIKAVQSLLNRQAISSEDLLDVLMVQQKFEVENFDVVDVALNICLHSADIPQNRRPYVLQDIWRRIFIAGPDQDSVNWRLNEFTDLEVREKLMNTWMARAYSVIYRAEGLKDDLLLDRPQDAKCTMPAESFKERFSGAFGRDQTNSVDENLERNYKAMIRDYELENKELERRIRDGQLVEKWKLVQQIVKEEATGVVAGGVPSFGLGSQDVEMQDVEIL